MFKTGCSSSQHRIRCSMSSNETLRVDPLLRETLKDLSREVLRHQPDDIYKFCYEFFKEKLESRDGYPEEMKQDSPKEPEGAEEDTESEDEDENYQPPDMDDDDDDDDEMEEESKPISSGPARARRSSVSAESMNPDDISNDEKVVVPKTDEQKQRIENSIRNNFLFRNLEEDLFKEVVDAMFEKKVESGENVIKQGDEGDYFYTVESGTFDCFVAKKGEAPIKVVTYSGGSSFGELALMYGAPRAATVTATSDAIIWALDRKTFRRILMDVTFRKRRMYESFLEDLPLLASLEPYERHKIADALETITFEDGDVVIKQGDQGESFYLIESGEAEVTKTDEKGTHKFPSLKEGSYFGELALLNDKPRVATITAKGKLKCATLGKKAFTRLLGPCLDILKRSTENYEKIASVADI